MLILNNSMDEWPVERKSIFERQSDTQEGKVYNYGHEWTDMTVVWKKMQREFCKCNRLASKVCSPRAQSLSL